MTLTPTPAALRRHNLIFLSEARRWPAWPFLPVVRRRPRQEEEYGLLYDALGAKGWTGYSATVFLANLFTLPPYVADFLTLPREVYDTPEEVFDADWRVD